MKIFKGAMLLLALTLPLAADVLPSPFTLDLPFAPNAATPIWLGHPTLPASSFASLKLPVIPPDENASLLITVFFQEKAGGFLRVSWKGAQRAQLLSRNFYEGIGMNNQRSLLIGADTLAGPGALHFLSGSGTLGIARVKLEWLENRPGLVSPLVQDLLVTPAIGPAQLSQNLNGEVKLPEAAGWHDRMVTIPITATPERIEEGVEYSVQLDEVPSAGRVLLKEAGLPWGQRLVVWVNEERVGTITPTVPDLTDDIDQSAYTGWRDGSFYLPAAALKKGANTLLFSSENESAPTEDSAAKPISPLALKELVLQLKYSIPSAPTIAPVATGPQFHLSVPPPQLNELPTGPLSSDSTASTSN